MSPVESYIVATVFIAAAGFSCGYSICTLEMSNAKELANKSSTVLTLLGLATIPALFVYGIRWGLLVDGPHFIWVPALIAWLSTLSYGRSWAHQDRSALQPWRLPIVGTIVVAGSYHLLHEYLTR